MAYNPLFDMFIGQRQKELDTADEYLKTSYAPNAVQPEQAPMAQPQAAPPQAPPTQAAPFASPQDEANARARQNIMGGMPQPVGTIPPPPRPQPAAQVAQETMPQPAPMRAPEPTQAPSPAPQAPMPYNEQMSQSNSAPGIMFRELTSGGLPDHIAYGFLGNIQQESAFNPGAYNKKEDAHGAVQWRGERLANLRRFAKDNDLNVGDMATQGKFILWELKNTERAAYDRLMRTKTPEEAAAVIDQFYERSAGTEREERMRYAANWAAGKGNLGLGSLSSKGGSPDQSGQGWNGVNPYLTGSGEEPAWEPKNWQERILGTKPKDENDMSPGAQLRRRRGAQLQALGLGLSQMGQGQTVDISSVLNDAYRQRKDMMKTAQELKDKQLAQQENAKLFEALPDDLKPIATTQKGMDIATSIMTERMKKEADPKYGVSPAVIKQAQKYGLDYLLADPNPEAQKQGLESLAAIQQAQNTPSAENKAPLSAEEIAAALPMVQQYAPDLASQIEAGSRSALDKANDIYASHNKGSVTDVTPAEVEAQRQSIEQLFPEGPDFPPLTQDEQRVKKAAMVLSTQGRRGFDKAADLIAEYGKQGATGNVLQQETLAMELAETPAEKAAALDPTSRDEFLKQKLAQGAAEVERARVEGTVQDKLRVLQENPLAKAENLIGKFGADVSNPAGVDAALAALGENYTGQQQLTRQLEAQNNQSRLTQEDEKYKADLKVATEATAKEKLRSALMDPANPDRISPDEWAQVAHLDADQIKSLFSKELEGKIANQTVIDLEATQRKAAADGYATIYGKDSPIYRAALSNTTVADRMANQAEKIADETRKQATTEAANAKLAALYTKFGHNDLAERVSQGDAEGAQKEFAKREGTPESKDISNYVYMSGLKTPEEKVEFLKTIRDSAGVEDPAKKVALETKAKQIGESMSAQTARLQKMRKLTDIVNILQTSNVDTGAVASTLFPVRQWAADLGVGWGDGATVQEIFDSASKGLISDMKVVGGGPYTDADAARDEKVITNLGKTPEANMMVAQRLLNQEKIATITADTELLELGKRGLDSISSSKAAVNERLADEGLGYFDEKGKFNQFPTTIVLDTTNPASVAAFEKYEKYLPQGTMFLMVDEDGPTVMNWGEDYAPQVGK